jgi:hypothetical protein
VGEQKGVELGDRHKTPFPPQSADRGGVEQRVAAERVVRQVINGRSGEAPAEPKGGSARRLTPPTTRSAKSSFPGRAWEKY